MSRMIIALVVMSLGVLAGCGTTDTAMREQGRSESYVLGFHDGRHSGMKEEGNLFEQFIRDEAGFENDPDYRAGWLDGEKEGQKLQYEANIASATYSGYQAGKAYERSNDVNRISEDALKDIDTSSLKNLEKDY
mgnify:FL=1